jgi:TonB family protein
MATQASDSIRQQPRTNAADELAVIAQRAQSFTNASGAAIAIGEGSSMDEIVCRARSGSSSPDVGAVLRVQGTFTGICIQTGKELRCDDAETDTRVDMSAIRALGIRSMVVTPIRDEGKVVGVLAVFAPMPHAFTITHVAVLKTMADQISALLQKERRTKDEPHAEIPAPAAAPVVMPKPPVAVPKPPVAASKSPVAVPLPPPVVIKPASVPSSASAGAAATPAPARVNVSTAPKIEMQPVALAAEIAPPVPFPKREEKREFKPEPSPAPKPSFGTFDAVAGDPQKSSSSKLIVMGVLVMAVIAAGASWYFLRTHKSSSPAPVQSAQQAQNSAPATPVAPPNPAVTTVTAVSSPASGNSLNTKAAVAERTEVKKNDSKKKDQPTTPPEPTPTTLAIGSGPSKIAQPAPVDQSPEVSPTLAVGGGSSSGLASLARPLNNSTPARVAQSDLVNSRAIHMVPAVYPEMAKSRRISGTVVVKVTVGKDGKAKNPVLISGPVIFRDAAFDSVKQWLFKPAELNGQAIEQDTEIRVVFNNNNH